MSRSPQKSALERLKQAIGNTPAFTCEQAQDQLALLVEAESLGEDVDNQAQFRDVLNHLDHCEDCAELYAQIAEDVDALFSDTVPALQTPQNIPTFFTPARQTDAMELHVLGGLAQRFRLWFRLPQLQAQADILGKNPQAHPLFVDEIPEVANKPVVSVTLLDQEHGTELRVAIRDLSSKGPWQVTLESSQFRVTQTTNEQGLVSFIDVPLHDTSEITIHCSLA
jgi:hypothetical protein